MFGIAVCDIFARAKNGLAGDVVMLEIVSKSVAEIVIFSLINRTKSVTTAPLLIGIKLPMPDNVVVGLVEGTKAYCPKILT
jgi:hypothetical protein